MLIKVKGDGHNIVVPIPTALIFNRATAKIVVKSAQKSPDGKFHPPVPQPPKPPEPPTPPKPPAQPKSPEPPKPTELEELEKQLESEDQSDLEKLSEQSELSVTDNYTNEKENLKISTDNGIHFVKQRKDGKSELHFTYNKPNSSDKENEDGEKFPFTEQQLVQIMKEIRRCKRYMKGIPLVEVKSSDGDEVIIYL